MIEFLRFLRRIVWFHIGFASVVVFALWAETARALPCTDGSFTRETYAAACQAVQNFVNSSGGVWQMAGSSCDAGGYMGFGVVPACGRQASYQTQPSYLHGFLGTCPSGDDGPNIDWTGGAGETMPTYHCVGPCKVQNSGTCTSMGPMPDGTMIQGCGSTYTGQTCIPSPAAPEPDPNEPFACDQGHEVDGACLTIEDGDGNESNGMDAPEVCLGGPGLCNEIPPNPNHSADCSTAPNGAICVGNPNEPNSAPAPGAPWPPAQNPDFSTNANGGGGPTPVDIYGPPMDGDAGPPDENGNCPSGTTNNGQGSCMCPAGDIWNGTACADGDGDSNGEEDGVCDETNPDDPDCQDGERSAEYGTCGETPPQCSGDEIDCSILRQTWATRCALIGSDAPPEVDLDEDPLQQYGGADSFFETVGGDDGSGPNGLDYSGFLSSGGCPSPPPPVQVLGTSWQFPPVWCDLGFLYFLTVGVAVFIAARIVMGDD